MTERADEDELLLSVARQTTQSIFLARQRAEEELLRTKAELEAASTAKSRFLNMISHELRTPLGAIGGYAQLMADGIAGALGDQNREFVERILHNQKHILRLVDELLDIAKIESGRIGLNMRPMSLQSTIENVYPMIEPQIRERGLLLEIEPIDRALRVNADPDRVQQIVLNLLSNATKFTPDGSSIRVTATTDADKTGLHVRDRGIGIAADKLETIFEPFVQAGQSQLKTTRGTGLGLTISRQLARAMGGDLIAESTLGEGSTFTLTLPRSNGQGG
jgi:signal transduction histidine kinase